MAIKFPTDEWIKALCDEVNKSEAYAQAAATWEGDFYFVVESGSSLSEPVYLHMDLWHGKCRGAGLMPDPAEKKPAFVLSASVSDWRKVIEKQLDPIKGMMTRKLKLKGDMMKIMKVPKAAAELVNCCTLVPTEFPE
ncbi:MAG: SCP2 sterol-binding domain-containing protein [Chloroflexota bacterium]|nr:SCP2 sterol-binding domain-containing protein [Chloroflexota bacterium]